MSLSSEQCWKLSEGRESQAQQGLGWSSGCRNALEACSHPCHHAGNTALKNSFFRYTDGKVTFILVQIPSFFFFPFKASIPAQESHQRPPPAQPPAEPSCLSCHLKSPRAPGLQWESSKMTALGVEKLRSGECLAASSLDFLMCQPCRNPSFGTQS